MKERIKKFCKENTEACAYMLATIVTTTAYVVITRTVIDGLQVDRVTDKVDEEGQHVKVYLKNGTYSSWTKPGQ